MRAVNVRLLRETMTISLAIELADRGTFAG